jgi:hypothetical protein
MGTERIRVTRFPFSVLLQVDLGKGSGFALNQMRDRNRGTTFTAVAATSRCFLHMP